MDILFDLGMATGPVLGYIHQYILIKQQKSVGTFSIDICGILLFANILRLNFFIFNRYQLALFFQSLIMITAQICLIQICTKYANKKIIVTDSQTNLKDRNYDSPQSQQKFWRWNKFSSYVCFIGVFAFSSLTLSILFKKLQSEKYGVFIGLVALLSQSMLIMPQIMQNYNRKSTKGLSRVLVGLNLSGDILKLIYFLMKNQSFQFVLCGVIQVILDSFVVIQIVYYNSLQEDKFAKQNRSLVLENKNSSPQKKKEIYQLEEIQMQNMEDQSPQDDFVQEQSYINHAESQVLDDLPPVDEQTQKQQLFPQPKTQQNSQKQIISLSTNQEQNKTPFIEQQIPTL